MITVTVKEYDGWFDVLETADLYGVVDLDWELSQIDLDGDDSRLDEIVDDLENRCFQGLARRGVVFEL